MNDSMDIAKRIASKYGLEFVEHDDPNIEAKILGDGVALVIYLHKTSANNYHLRVRDENSKNPRLAFNIADELDAKTGLNCTFSMKLESLHKLRDRAERQLT